MLTTGCEGCCFLKSDERNFCGNGRGKGCLLGQLCAIQEDGKAFAPGYCRMCRSHKWARKQQVPQLESLHDLSRLYEILTDELVLRCDMMVFFDEAIHHFEDLDYTLGEIASEGSFRYSQYVKKIIIADVTGFGPHRQNLAMKYINSRSHTMPIVVDSSVESESVNQRGDTLQRLSKQVTSPFFLAIPAGSHIVDFDLFARMIRDTRSRVIHWSFPLEVGSTVVVPNKLQYGLFITKPYRALMKSPETQYFADAIRKEEIETGMTLSWFCADNLMTTNGEIKC